MTPTYTQRKGYQLIVNVFQASILNLYNEQESYTYKELSERTQIPKNRLDAGLIMMCKPGMKLLEKQVSKPSFDNPNELIKINPKWQVANILVKLVPIGAAKKKAHDEQHNDNKLHEEVSKERGAVIDGAIVKIMKTNKDAAVKHQELVIKVMEMISLFKAQPPQIKMRIEDLIMKQYMRRDDKDRTKYWYVA